MPRQLIIPNSKPVNLLIVCPTVYLPGVEERAGTYPRNILRCTVVGVRGQRDFGTKLGEITEIGRRNDGVLVFTREEELLENHLGWLRTIREQMDMAPRGAFVISKHWDSEESDQDFEERLRSRISRLLRRTPRKDRPHVRFHLFKAIERLYADATRCSSNKAAVILRARMNANTRALLQK